MEIEKDRQDSISDDVRVSAIQDFYSGISEIFDRPISQAEAAAVQPEITQSDAGAVRINYAGIDDSTTTQSFKFTLVGNHNAPVQVTRITARVTASRPPASGGLVFFQSQGGSSIGKVGFDLDSANKSARTLDGDGHLTNTNFFDTQQINLEKDEPFEFLATVAAGRAEYDYVLDVQFLDGSRQTLMNDGSPWRISAIPPTFNTAYSSFVTGDGGVTTKPCVWPQCRSTQ